MKHPLLILAGLLLSPLAASHAADLTFAGIFADHAVNDRSTVVATSGKIARLVTGRYGWAQVPDVDLFNRGALPAAAFRTDVPKDTAHAAESNRT